MQRSARIELIKASNRTKLIKSRKDRSEHSDWKSWFAQSRMVGRRKKQYIEEERQARRDDWIAGPLAANRNIGKARGTYGTLDALTSNYINVPTKAQTHIKRLGLNDIKDDGSVAPKLAFKGRTILGNVAINDRVVVVEGPARIKGIVGTIKSIGSETETVVLKDINMADVALSNQQKVYAAGGSQAVPFFETQEIPIPTKDVRLVYDIEDPQTGQKKAVIIRHVHADGPYSARPPYSSWPSHSRYATGTGHLTADGQDIRLDWPEEIPGEISRRLEHDTSASRVEEDTWTPELRDVVGYPAETVQLKEGKQGEAPEGRYTAGIPRSESNYEYFFQRLGLHGFINQAKLEARQQKIAAGIMAELRGGSNTSKLDYATNVKRRVMEDARAIWWKERQVLSPVAEAAKKSAGIKKQLKDARLSKVTEHNLDAIVDSALVESLQTVALKDRYRKADHRLTKRLPAKNASADA